MLLIAVLSATVCVAVDTMAGIMVGAIISLLMFVDNMSMGQADVSLKHGAKVNSSVNLAVCVCGCVTVASCPFALLGALAGLRVAVPCSCLERSSYKAFTRFVCGARPRARVAVASLDP